MAKRSTSGLRGIVNGTTYKDETPQAVINVLEQSRAAKQRICIIYGDVKTGRAWGDRPECGHIGRSTGDAKIPLIIKTRRSTGGEGVLDHVIVRITTTTRPKRVLYSHPKFRKPLHVLAGARR